MKRRKVKLEPGKKEGRVYPQGGDQRRGKRRKRMDGFG